MQSNENDDVAGIAIIGAGLIVENAHLPAYMAKNLCVRGVYDVNPEAADRLAGRYGIKAYTSMEELLDDPGVRVVDCAVTPQVQERIASTIMDTGRHVLCQKPLADSMEMARQLVEHAEAAGVKLAVNQQMRWEPTIQEMHRRIASGWVGEPVVLNYHLNFMGEYPGVHWLNEETRLFARYGTIHYVDSARFLFGEPIRVTARLLKDKVQFAKAETFVNAWIEWPNGIVLVAFERYTSKTGGTDCRVELEGTEGAVRGLLGLYRDYPKPHPDVIEAMRYSDPHWRLVSDTERWLPDAFAQPMLSLLEAIRTDGEPETSGRDNLKTLGVVEALYESDRLGQTIEMNPEGS